MPSYSQILKEVRQQPDPLAALETKRLGYIHDINTITDRNIIAYYSAFLQKPNLNQTGIDDNDKNAFMQAVHGLDRSKGLDLILHTPGGNLAATESLVIYLKQMFGNDIRAFVPQIAMSAGTMIALAAKEIVMGKQSNLGPIDPQFGGISCAGIIEEFNTAVNAVKINPASAAMWGMIIQKYHPTFIGECDKAIKWAEKMAKDWLAANMFHSLTPKKRTKTVDSIVEKLSSHTETFSHQRHIHMEELSKLGLKIVALEELDSKKIGGCTDLQDCVLTLHHAYMQCLSVLNIRKIIENHIGSNMAMLAGVQVPNQKK